MEPRFGYSFSDVRVHTDACSAEAAQARAYTVGRDIVFGDGMYSPGTEQGRLLLAHELMHVVQQASGTETGTPTSAGIELSDPFDRSEREADYAARRVGGQRAGDRLSIPGLAGRSNSSASHAPATARKTLQRDPDRGPGRRRAATSAVLAGTLTLPSRNVVTYRVELRNAPSILLPQNERELDLECQSGIAAAFVAEGKTAAPTQASFDLHVDVLPSQLLKKGYVAALVTDAARAEMRSKARAAKPAVVTPEPSLAETFAANAPVLAELAHEARATFVDPLGTELVKDVGDEEAQRLIDSVIPALRVASAQTIAAADAERVRKPRAAFRKRHSDHGEQVLDNIDRALEAATKGHVELQMAFYKYYADNKLTDELDPASGDLGKTDHGDTDLRKDVLALQPRATETDDPLSLLGGTLIHEFVHTSQRGLQLHARGEAKAYGIEYFLVERMGKDQKRLEIIESLNEDRTAMDQRLGVHQLFLETRRTMEALYAVIDRTGGRMTPEQAKLSPDQARELLVEFLTHDEGDYGPTLTTLISEVSSH